MAETKMRTWIVVCGDSVSVKNCNSLEEAKAKADHLDTSRGMFIAEIVATCIPKPTWVDGSI